MYVDQDGGRFMFFSSWRSRSKNKHLQTSTIRLFFNDIRKTGILNAVYHTRTDGKKLHRISPHTLRHFAAYNIYEASGKDLSAVQQFLGHSKITTTSKYINAFKDVNRRMMVMEKFAEKI